MAAWPSTLPGPLVDGYAISPVEQTVRTDMEVGAARVRRRSFARNDLVDVSFLFTGAQFATFRAWSESDGAGGAAWFEIDLDVDGVIAPEEARFKGAWKAARNGIYWKITAQLEVR
ncbi:hypothetical protein [Pseudomonas sp.]|uniref:hypothetical protein n=1 Tax=Pseudomonas sp. TaxID=306 RepID=UPI003F39F244